jgi:hypothetical protein
MEPKKKSQNFRDSFIYNLYYTNEAPSGFPEVKKIKKEIGYGCIFIHFLLLFCKFKQSFGISKKKII